MITFLLPLLEAQEDFSPVFTVITWWTTTLTKVGVFPPKT